MALDNLSSAYDELEAALNDLRDVREEYAEWQSNLPENLQQSALGEKLSEIVDQLEIPDDPREYSFTDLETAIDQAEGAELPLGFGRD